MRNEGMGVEDEVGRQDIDGEIDPSDADTVRRHPEAELLAGFIEVGPHLFQPVDGQRARPDLLIDDIQLSGPISHVVVREHQWRRLKTTGSARTVPLAGAALWAAQRIVAEVRDSRFAFPRYNRTDNTNANSASAALNKWMKQHAPEGCTMHGFRHSMRDRLRAVECPSDIVDQIGGWQTEGVGHSYGRGYPLEVLAKWVEAAA